MSILLKYNSPEKITERSFNTMYVLLMCKLCLKQSAVCEEVLLIFYIYCGVKVCYHLLVILKFDGI